MAKIAVVGASGDVGQGIVSESIGAGHEVIAVGRSLDRLNKLGKLCNESKNLNFVEGSLASREQADKLAAALSSEGPIDVMVTSINGKPPATAARELTADLLDQVMHENVLTHVVAAQALISVVKPGGMYIAIGGGMADLVFPGNVLNSMAQAAQRMFFRYLAKEGVERNVSVKELMLYSMINGESTRDKAEDFWITDREVGKHFLAILNDPATFEGEILTLKSRKQVGLPERK